MRHLTLNRKKSFIACACAVYIYLSCKPEDSTTFLNGVPCKLIGKIKNGKSLDLDVTEEAFTVFVAYSRTMPETFNAKYSLPCGTEDVVLLTRPHFNPFLGNPFDIVNGDQAKK